MSFESQNSYSNDNVSHKPHSSDFFSPGYSLADHKQSLRAAEAAGHNMAQKTVDTDFGKLEIHGIAGLKPVADRLRDNTSHKNAQLWEPADPEGVTHPQHAEACPGAVSSDATKLRETEASHGFVLADVTKLKLQWNRNANKEEGTTFTPDSIKAALDERMELLKLNPNLVTVAEVRYHDAKPGAYEEKYYQHKDNEPIKNQSYPQFHMLNWNDPAFRDFVVDQARSVMASGAADGVMLDWMNDGHDGLDDKKSKLELLVKLRKECPTALIMINTNEKTLDEVFPNAQKDVPGVDLKKLVNSQFIEAANADGLTEGAEYQRIARVLADSTKSTMHPQATVLETWRDREEPRYDARFKDKQERQMRATTTLAMTLINGFSSYGDPDSMKDACGKPLNDHRHQIYPFYKIDLGQPLSEKPTPLPASVDGANGEGIQREYANGTVVSNAEGDRVITTKFKDDRYRLSDHASIPAGTEVDVNPQDGDIFVKVQH